MQETKTAFATRLGISPGRLSQMISSGFPVTAGGKVDVMAGAGWIVSNLNTLRHGAETVARAKEAQAHALAAGGAEFAVSEAPVAVVLAAADLGVPRELAEKLADHTLALLAHSVVGELEAADIPNIRQAFGVPHPRNWRKGLNWPGLYDGDGQSRMAGQLREDAAD